MNHVPVSFEGGGEVILPQDYSTLQSVTSPKTTANLVLGQFQARSAVFGLRWIKLLQLSPLRFSKVNSEAVLVDSPLSNHFAHLVYIVVVVVIAIILPMICLERGNHWQRFRRSGDLLTSVR